MAPKRNAAAAAEAAAAAARLAEPDEIDSDPEAELEVELVEKPFDITKHDLVLDVRAMTELPFDPDASGVKSFRAFVFEKGKSMHAPGEAGKYIIAGEWFEQWALALVHFIPSTKREPELLLNFVDYGMLSQNNSGISVETLALPLKVAKNVYNDTPRLTMIADVAGFSTIDAGKTPWSTNLAACLKKHPLFVSHDVLMPKHLLEWLKKKTLKQRLLDLEINTRKAINKEVAAMRKQDESQADKIQAIFMARLAKTLESLKALPPQAYDCDERIIVLKPDDDQAPLPLTTPLRKKVLEGESELVRTQLVVRSARETFAAPPAAATAPTPVVEPIVEEEPLPAPDEDDVDDVPQEEVEATNITILEGRRARLPTNRFADLEPAAKKPKVPASTSSVPEVGWEDMINPRTGLPYKRAPYSKKEKGLLDLKKLAVKGRKGAETSAGASNASAVASEAAAAAAEKWRVKEAALKEKINTLELNNLRLEKDLAVLLANQEREKSDAFRKGGEDAKREVTQIILESKEEYKKGLADGARLATGRTFSLAHNSRHTDSISDSYGGSSSRNGRRSSSNKSRFDEREESRSDFESSFYLACFCFPYVA